MFSSVMAAIDSILGWKIRWQGAVQAGQSTKLVWRRINRAAGNRLTVGDHSIVLANIRFEDSGGSIRIGNRCFIGKSDLVCYRSIDIRDDVIMSWGVKIIDNNSHSLDWQNRRADGLECHARR